MNEEFSTMDILDLADVLLTWFPSTTPKAVTEYVERFPSDRRGVLPSLKEELLNKLRIERRHILEKHFEGPIVRLLREPHVTIFLALCTKYNAQSVLHNYQKDNPKLASITVRSNVGVDVSQFLAKWTALLHFLSAEKYLEQKSLLTSVLTLDFDNESLKDLSLDLEDFQKWYQKELVKNSYAPLLSLPPEQFALLKQMFVPLDFIPVESVAELLKPESYVRLLALLNNLEDVLEICLVGSEEGIPTDDVPAYCSFLRKALIDDAETELAIEHQARVIDMEDDETGQSIGTYEDNLMHYFVQLFLPNLLSGGLVPDELTKAIQALAPSTKSMFQECFGYFVEQSPIVRRYLTPLDPIAVLLNIKEAESKAAIPAVVRELLDRVDPENLTLAAAILTAIARVYYP